MYCIFTEKIKYHYKMSLTDEYLNLAITCSSTDYSDKKSIRQHNIAVGKMYQIAKDIAKEPTKDIINNFVKLLNVDADKVNIWAAVHILELIKVDEATRLKALSIIKEVANENSTDALGYRIWLKNYEKL